MDGRTRSTTRKLYIPRGGIATWKRALMI
jgi:hypothetical protein